MLCFSVDSKDSFGNVESKWVGDIAENCQGVKLVLVALECDLRKREGDEEEGVGDRGEREKVMIDYEQGLEVAKRIQALRYLGGSSDGIRVLEGNNADDWGDRVFCETKPRRQ